MGTLGNSCTQQWQWRSSVISSLLHLSQLVQKVELQLQVLQDRRACTSDRKHWEHWAVGMILGMDWYSMSGTVHTTVTMEECRNKAHWAIGGGRLGTDLLLFLAELV